jgi:hypothetical protein
MASNPRASRPPCRAALYAPSAATLLARIDGHLDALSARQLARAIAEAFPARGRVQVHFDVFDLATYDNEARTVLVNVLRPRLGRIDAIHVLSSSALVRMGAAVANLALGGRVQQTGDRAEFGAWMARSHGGPIDDASPSASGALPVVWRSSSEAGLTVL